MTYFGLVICIHGKQSHHATAQFACMANAATEAAEEGGCAGQPGQHRTNKTAKLRTVPSTELPHNLARPTGAIHRFSIRHSSSKLPKIQNTALCAKLSSGLPEALHCHRQPIIHCSFRERGSALCAAALPQHPYLAARHPHICLADGHCYMRLTLTCGTHKSQRKQPAFDTQAVALPINCGPPSEPWAAPSQPFAPCPARYRACRRFSISASACASTRPYCCHA